MQASKHPLETDRLKALYRYEVLDTPPERAFDDITRLVAAICQVPIAVINLIDAERQWFKSEIGLGVRETPLDISICAHAILQPGFFTVPDTLQDSRFTDNPLVTGDPRLRFYAGVLLETPDGYPLGTLCALDYQPRELSEDQKAALLALGRQVMELMELKVRNKQLQRSVSESHHRIKNSLQVLAALVEIQNPVGEDNLRSPAMVRIGQHIQGLSTIHDLLTLESKTGSQVETLSASDTLHTLIDSLQRMLTDRRIHIQISPVPLSVKQATSSVILVNELLSNAVKHSTGDIEIVLESEAETATLIVTDHGAGFPDDFDPMVSSNTGLELILSLAQWDLKGDITFGNRPGGGGCVTVTFPLHQGSAL